MSKESFTQHDRNPEDVTSGNKTQNDIETKEDFRPKTGYDDAFFINKENESITWIYFNLDSVSGGQYVTNMLSFDEIRKATQDYESADDFFDYLGSIANQTLADVGTEWFEEAENAFRQTPDLTNCSTETMEKLTALTEERYKSIPQDKVIDESNVDINDQLSNNAYYYDSKERLFSLASEHEKRSKNIDNKSVNSKKNVDNFLDRTNKFSKDNDVSKENISKNNEIEF